MIFLLDTNVLIALASETHVHHAKTQDWFARKGSRGWATCPITQARFVRIMSNPGMSPYALPPDHAASMLHSNMQHPHHHHWPDEITFPEALDLLGVHLRGHRQVTDIYLMALAAHKKGRLATLDSSIPLIAAENRRSKIVEFI